MTGWQIFFLIFGIWYFLGLVGCLIVEYCDYRTNTNWVFTLKDLLGNLLIALIGIITIIIAVTTQHETIGRILSGIIIIRGRNVPNINTDNKKVSSNKKDKNGKEQDFIL